jgi:hypothetical protein
MKRLLCTTALAGFACAASAQLADPSGSAKSFAGQDSAVVALLSHPAGARSFNDALAADARADTSGTDSGATAGATPTIPEPQTYALLLAGLGAVVFVAVRRRRP